MTHGSVLHGMRVLSILLAFSFCQSTLAQESDGDAAAQEEPAKSIFPDKALEDVVRQYVFEKRHNDEPLTAADVESISTIEGKHRGIKDLTGLEHCLSLALLDLEDNQIKDLKPVAELTNLQSVNLAHNEIEDIGPLKKLNKLQYLHLANNQIGDLAPIAEATNMRSLYLSHNQISDLSPLNDLTKIWSLYVDHNQLTEVPVVSEFPWLSSLDLRNNQISDLSPLKPLTELKYLMLDHNQIKDLTILVEMATADAEGAQRFAPFWNIYLGGNPLEPQAKGDQVAKLEELGAKVTLEPLDKQSQE